MADERGRPLGDDERRALAPLGLTPAIESAYAELGDASLVLARVTRADRGGYWVQSGRGLGWARLSASLRNRRDGVVQTRAAVGDWVALRMPPRSDAGIVEAILPRSSAFVRKEAGRDADPQVIAANVDVVLIVHSLAMPLHVRRIERELALTHESGARPVIVFTKADLCDEIELWLEAVQAVAAGVPVHVTSSVSGAGLDEVAAYVQPGQTVALIGPSGVGKSTMVNRLLGAEVQATAEVREKDGRGRHTTVTRELLALPNGGLLMDTPGLRSLSLWDNEAGLAQTFAEVLALAATCRFRDCAHEGEPGCAVLAAVEDGSIDAERYEAFKNLQGELDGVAADRDLRQKQERKRKEKIIARASRAFFKKR